MGGSLSWGLGWGAQFLDPPSQDSIAAKTKRRPDRSSRER